jgi:Protein of unknown function (DUF2851)
MQESFLHFVWLTGLFRSSELYTTDKQEITIIKRGQPHQDGGPDFTYAKLRIGKQLWVGHVEIHVKSSEWFLHRHHQDKSYDTTILHVCYNCNQPVYRSDGSSIPCLELETRVDPNLINRYEALIRTTSHIPCAQVAIGVDNSIKSITLEQMMSMRLEQRYEQILVEIENIGQDWNNLFYHKLFQAFGLRINKDPFGILANLLPYGLILKYADKPIKLESLLFGSAGFLAPKGRDSYEEILVQEFKFLQHKHNLHVMPLHSWKFLRLRPANFPTIRLAQLSQFLSHGEHLFSRIQGSNNIDEIYKLFEAKVPTYWRSHFRFGEVSAENSKQLGRGTIDLILINAVVPILFANALWRKDEGQMEKAIALLESIPGENNKITRKYKELGFPVSKASSTQGILHLAKNFCTFKRCLDCPVGHQILRG